MTPNQTIAFGVPTKTLTDRKNRPRHQLYVVSTQAIADRATMNAKRTEHIAYLNHLDKCGKLVAAGPVLSEDAAFYDGHGLIILRADSVAAAIQLASADPFHVHGIRNFTVTPWLLSEGTLHDVLVSFPVKSTVPR